MARRIIQLTDPTGSSEYKVQTNRVLGFIPWFWHNEPKLKHRTYNLLSCAVADASSLNKSRKSVDIAWVDDSVARFYKSREDSLDRLPAKIGLICPNNDEDEELSSPDRYVYTLTIRKKGNKVWRVSYESIYEYELLYSEGDTFDKAVQRMLMSIGENLSTGYIKILKYD